MRTETRLLIIDDSSYNRRAIADFFVSYPDVRIVGKASDGQEGLQMALNENPTVITLDLEMPRIDGFAFLRLLMSSQPTPVIVISSHANTDNIFRALELGAFDFIAKPETGISRRISEIGEQVVQKVLSAGKYNSEALRALSSSAPPTGMHFISGIEDDAHPEEEARTDAKKIIAIGASTGGPASIVKVLTALPEDLDAGIVISLHMPSMFTSTYAERLDRLSPLSVMELQEPQAIKAGCAYLAPGGYDIILSWKRNAFRVEKEVSSPQNRYSPNVDRMLETAASAAKDRLLAVVLTGMGDDGAAGAQDVVSAGGKVIVEAEDTAVVFGMPGSVLEKGVEAGIRPLNLIANSMVSFAGRR